MIYKKVDYKYYARTLKSKALEILYQ